MKSIVLIGYMGAGKTTIGHAMAKEMGLQFYDLDWYIEMRFHRTVAQIFEGCRGCCAGGGDFCLAKCT